jgi:hypothetical protein
MNIQGNESKRGARSFFLVMLQLLAPNLKVSGIVCDTSGDARNWFLRKKIECDSWEMFSFITFISLSVSTWTLLGKPAFAAIVEHGAKNRRALKRWSRS